MTTANHCRFCRAASVLLACVSFALHADTLLWYRFDGDGATIVNKANPGTMDGALKSINTWGSLNGLGDTSSKFPTRGDAFSEGVRLIDPVTDAIQSDTVKSLTFSGDPANSGTARLLKADATAALKEMMSCTCEVFFKLPSDSAAIETRRAKDILFPLVDWGSPDGGGYGWFLGLRKDSNSSGFYSFFRSKHHTGSSAPQTDVQQNQQNQKVYISDANWHHMALRITADTSAHTASVELLLDYTVVATGSLSGFYGFHNNNSGNFPFLVGADLWRTSKSCCFMGEIAEVRVSDTALAVNQLLRPLPEGPVDADTLVYLPMGDCDWFGSPSAASYKNIYHGALNAAPTASCTPYWFFNDNASVTCYPVVAADAIGEEVRDGYFAAETFADEKSITFSRMLVSGQYYGHVLRIPYENAHLAEGSFTMEWFFKTDGEVPTSANGSTSYTFMNNTFAKILINQANGKLLTRLVKPSGSPNYEDFNSASRVDDAQWHHYALVYDKSQGAFAAYLDYRMIVSKTYSLTAETGTAFCFGGEGRSKQVFSGQLDDFRITRRAMKAGEFLTTRQIVSADAALFAHFEGDLSTGQDAALAPAGAGGTLGGGTAPTFVDVSRRIDLDGDGAEDYESTKALRLDGGSVVWPHNSLLECRDFTVEWFARYESIEDVSMLLRLGMMSDIGTGTISWALYRSGGNLRFDANVSPDGSWKDIYRPDYNFATIADSGIADGKWHHLALVAETHPDATPANTTFTFYKDYERVGNPLVFNCKDGAGGILAFPSTGTTLSIGTGGKAVNGMIDELRFRPGVQPVSSFMRRLPNGFIMTVK